MFKIKISTLSWNWNTKCAQISSSKLSKIQLFIIIKMSRDNKNKIFALKSLEFFVIYNLVSIISIKK